jgi:hypothetical protein
VLRRHGRKLVGDRWPSADTIGYALSRVAPDAVRSLLHAVVRMARRRKALPGHLVLAADGHEFFSSQRRCCPECTVRRIKKGKRRVLEHYHRGVVCQFVGVTPPLIVDFEMQKRGEGEITAARRVLKRVILEFGRMISVVTLDALYCDWPLLRWIAKRGIQVVVVLKDNQKLANEELSFRSEWFPPEVVEGRDRVTEYWDVPWTKAGKFRLPVRLVRARRTRTRPPRKPGKVNRHERDAEEVQDWRFVVVGAMSAERADAVGHLRWEEENRGFHELATHWSMNHCFKHDFRAMQNILAMLFLVFGLTRLFFERNVKDAGLLELTHIAQADLLRESIPRPREACLWDPG